MTDLSGRTKGPCSPLPFQMQKKITGQFMEFEFWKTFLLNPEKPNADSPNRESLKAEFSKIVSWKARITNSILWILETRKNDEFVILAI